MCYYKKYFEKPEKDNPDLVVGHGTSEFGSFVHEILEDYEKGKLEIYDMLPYYNKNYKKKVTSDFTLRIAEDFYRDFAEDYFEDGREYLMNFEGFNDFDVIEAEYEFEEVIDNSFILIGKIDIVAKDLNDGKLIVVDHKSKSKFKNKKELKEYARQLYLYAYAIKQKYGEFPKKLMFNMFRKGYWESIDFNEDDYNEAMDWLKNSVKEIETTFEFPPIKDSFYCWNFCPYRYANFEECEVGES